MADKKYFRCDLSQVKATNRGGRLHSAQFNAELPNGVLGYLGDFISGSTEIRNFLAPTAELIKAKLPVIVMKPEINYKQDRATDNAIGIFRNPANKAFPAVPLEEFDGIDLSSDYFDLTGKASGKTKEAEVGDKFVLQANAVAGTQLKYSETAPLITDACFYFEVVDVVNSHIANYVYTDGSATATMFPQPYKMVKLALVRVAQ